MKITYIVSIAKNIELFIDVFGFSNKVLIVTLIDIVYVFLFDLNNINIRICNYTIFKLLKAF